MLDQCRAVATVPVRDLDGAREFYKDTLGLKPVHETDKEMLFECADGTAFTVFVSQGRTSGTHTQLSFLCADIDAEAADLRSRGVEFEQVDLPGATGSEGVYDLGEGRAAWFRDPEGNLLGVGQPSSA